MSELFRFKHTCLYYVCATKNENVEVRINDHIKGKQMIKNGPPKLNPDCI